MKKLTKITALALALALALGMTVMAAPTEVIKTVDFTGYTDLSALNLISFSDGSATKTYFEAGSAFTFGEGSFAYDKLYYQTASTNPNWAYMAITNINGVNTIAPNVLGWHNGSQPPLHVAFTLPEAWTTENDTALVVEMGVIPAERNKTGADNYHYQSTVKPVYSALLTEGTDGAESNVIRTLAGYGLSNTELYLLRLTQAENNASQTNVGGMPTQQESKITTVIRPFESEEEESLQLITGANKMGNANAYHISGYTPIKGVHGFQYGFMTSEMFGYTGYRLYEVSLDPADFAITSAKSFTDLDVTDSIKIVFSQPITTQIAGSAFGPYATTLENTLTITPEGGEALVYGEDYTFAIEEKADGTAIYDELTITPLKPWAFDTNYEVGIPDGFQNIARVAMTDTDAESANADAVVFTTEKAPTFDVTLKAYAGLTAAGTELPALADGTTYFAVSAAYSEGKVVANGTLRLEIKDAEGNTVKYVTAKKALGSGTATFGAAFKVEAGYTATASIDGGVIGTATID